MFLYKKVGIYEKARIAVSRIICDYARWRWSFVKKYERRNDPYRKRVTTRSIVERQGCNVSETRVYRHFIVVTRVNNEYANERTVTLEFFSSFVLLRSNVFVRLNPIANFYQLTRLRFF